MQPKIKNATFATQCNPYQNMRYNSDLLESKTSWARVSFCPFLLDLVFFSCFLCSFTRILYPYGVPM